MLRLVYTNSGTFFFFFSSPYGERIEKENSGWEETADLQPDLGAALFCPLKLPAQEGRKGEKYSWRERCRAEVSASLNNKVVGFFRSRLSLVIPSSVVFFCFFFLLNGKGWRQKFAGFGVDWKRKSTAVYFEPVFALVGKSSRHTKNKTLYLANTVWQEWNLLLAWKANWLYSCFELNVQSFHCNFSVFDFYKMNSLRKVSILSFSFQTVYWFEVAHIKTKLLLTFRMDFGLGNIDIICWFCGPGALWLSVYLSQHVHFCVRIPKISRG